MENFQAALYFYQNYFKKYNIKFDLDLLLKTYNKYLTGQITESNNPFFANFPQCNIIEFLLKLEESSK